VAGRHALTPPRYPLPAGAMAVIVPPRRGQRPATCKLTPALLHGRDAAPTAPTCPSSRTAGPAGVGRDVYRALDQFQPRRWGRRGANAGDRSACPNLVHHRKRPIWTVTGPPSAVPSTGCSQVLFHTGQLGGTDLFRPPVAEPADKVRHGAGPHSDDQVRQFNQAASPDVRRPARRWSATKLADRHPRPGHGPLSDITGFNPGTKPVRRSSPIRYVAALTDVHRHPGAPAAGDRPTCSTLAPADASVQPSNLAYKRPPPATLDHPGRRVGPLRPGQATCVRCWSALVTPGTGAEGVAWHWPRNPQRGRTCR